MLLDVYVRCITGKLPLSRPTSNSFASTVPSIMRLNTNQELGRRRTDPTRKRVRFRDEVVAFPAPSEDSSPSSASTPTRYLSTSDGSWACWHLFLPHLVLLTEEASTASHRGVNDPGGLAVDISSVESARAVFGDMLNQVIRHLMSVCADSGVPDFRRFLTTLVCGRLAVSDRSVLHSVQTKILILYVLQCPCHSLLHISNSLRMASGTVRLQILLSSVPLLSSMQHSFPVMWLAVSPIVLASVSVLPLLHCKKFPVSSLVFYLASSPFRFHLMNRCHLY